MFHSGSDTTGGAFSADKDKKNENGKDSGTVRLERSGRTLNRRSGIRHAVPPALLSQPAVKMCIALTSTAAADLTPTLSPYLCLR
jgi:hypothetical protein